MILQFRLITPEVDDFYRDILIKDSQTFLDLHNIIVIMNIYEMYISSKKNNELQNKYSSSEG